VDKPLTTSHCPGVYDLMELRAAIDVDRLAAAVSPFPYPWTDQAIIAGRDVTVRAYELDSLEEVARAVSKTLGDAPKPSPVARRTAAALY
jgi:predicted transcriptional regulator